MDQYISSSIISSLWHANTNNIIELSLPLTVGYNNENIYNKIKSFNRKEKLLLTKLRKRNWLRIKLGIGSLEKINYDVNYFLFFIL